MTIDEFIERLRGQLSFQIPVNANPYDDLISLEFDSIGVLELIVVVEAMANLSAANVNPPRLNTLADAFEYYFRCLAATS